jgi:acetoin utilization deacetylase AcuC-like enzyme
MLVLHDTATLQHETVELLGAKLIPALESPERIRAIVSALEGSNHKVLTVDHSAPSESGHDSRAPNALVDHFLASTHDAGYIEHLRTVHTRWVAGGLVQPDETVLPEAFPHRGLFTAGQQIGAKMEPPKDVFALAGYYAFDMSTGISSKTWVAARASANLAAEGARLVVAEDQNRSILALCRPPGHHCTTKVAGGYCYINNAVIAVAALRFHVSQLTGSRPSHPRIVILDLDFHHGNGTQDFFYDDPSVLYVSIHGLHEYPYYSGFEDEIGGGDGVGFNLNLPLAPRSSSAEYLEMVAKAMEAIAKYEPSHVILSLGFDTFVTDPLGSFQLDTEDYAKIACRIRSDEAIKHAPSLILLEGGYVIEKLGDNVLAFLQGWEEPEKSVSQEE